MVSTGLHGMTLLFTKSNTVRFVKSSKMACGPKRLGRSAELPREPTIYLVGTAASGNRQVRSSPSPPPSSKQIPRASNA